MESLREMCGTSRGLLPYLLSIVRLSEFNDYTPPPVEQSLASEGAFWFPDLLAGDPTGILPVLLTASILLNIRLGWKVKPISTLADLPRPEMIITGSFRVVRFAVQCLAVQVGFSAYSAELPCALVIFWMTSTNIATMQAFFVENYVYPVKPLQPHRKIYVGLRKGALEKQKARLTRAVSIKRA